MMIRVAALVVAIVGVLFPSQAVRAQPAAAPTPKTILATFLRYAIR